MSDKRKTVLITGASSGIGKELAWLFAADGYSLVLVARRKDELEKLARELKSKHDVFVKVVVMDLVEVGAAGKVFDKVREANLRVDVLVNNAGFALFGEFVELDLEDQIAMIQVNVMVLVELTHLFLPGMLGRKLGKILNVASTAAFLPGPLMSVYYASKHFVMSFSESLENEVGNRGVQVTTLVPGPTLTEFQKKAGVSKSRLIKGHFMEADEVAKTGYEGLMKGDRVVIVGWINRVTIGLAKLTPRSILVKLSRHIQNQKVKL